MSWTLIFSKILEHITREFGGPLETEAKTVVTVPRNQHLSLRTTQ